VPTTDDDRSHHALSRPECLRLLGTSGIGRLAYTEAALPAIRPVSYAVREADVVIPARTGSPFVQAVRGAVVAFQTDCFDGSTRTGWTVTVVGPSRVLTDAAVVPAPLQGAVGTGLPFPDGCLVAVQLGLVHGWLTTVHPQRSAAGVAVQGGLAPA
jgi:uncharacterized protein